MIVISHGPVVDHISGYNSTVSEIRPHIINPLQALWRAAADAQDLRAQLDRVQRSDADIAAVEAEDAEHWDRLVSPKTSDLFEI